MPGMRPGMKAAGTGVIKVNVFINGLILFITFSLSDFYVLRA
jgi:hypothetical protein